MLTPYIANANGELKVKLKFFPALLSWSSTLPQFVDGASVQCPRLSFLLQQWNPGGSPGTKVEEKFAVSTQH